MNLPLRLAARSDPGRIRPVNQDAFLLSPPLLAVADGMGGHRAGEVAARQALAALEERRGGADGGGEWLRDAVRAANRQVWNLARQRPEYRGMGTTLTAVLLMPERLWVAHVGDSRAYLFREAARELVRVTEDHSVAAELERSGVSRALLVDHPARHLLTRAVGVSPEVEVDLAQVPWLPGEGLLLCTDGLSGLVPEHEMLAALAGGGEPEEIVERLIRLANDRGGPDNVTVVLALRPAGEAEKES